MNGSKAGERADLREAPAAGDGWLCWAGLAGIILLAAALRFAGLRWGLPNELHSYSYHPDEFLTIGSSARVAGLLDGHRTINPGLYNYPSLYLYISALAMMVANGYGWLGNAASIYLTARVVTALMGLGAVGATYWAGRVMFGNVAGLLAALIIAIAPLHVQHSHFATVDVPSTLFVALCLGFSGLILKRGSWRDYILAGVMAGLAGGTKYNAVLVIFAPMAAHFLKEGIGWRQYSGQQTYSHISFHNHNICYLDSRLGALYAAISARNQLRDVASGGGARACICGDGEWVCIYVDQFPALRPVPVADVRVCDRCRVRLDRARPPRAHGHCIYLAILCSDLSLASQVLPIRAAAVSCRGHSYRVARYGVGTRVVRETPASLNRSRRLGSIYGRGAVLRAYVQHLLQHSACGTGSCSPSSLARSIPTLSSTRRISRLAGLRSTSRPAAVSV